MTNSEFIEEILHEAHSMGVATRVFEIANGLQSSGMDMPLAYDTAFKKVVSEMEVGEIRIL
jgi:hypothetical protein